MSVPLCSIFSYLFLTVEVVCIRSSTYDKTTVSIDLEAIRGLKTFHSIVSYLQNNKWACRASLTLYMTCDILAINFCCFGEWPK